MRWTGGGVNARRMSEVVPTVRPKQSSSPDQRAPDPGGTMPKQNVETPEPVLEAEVIYYAHDRFVCTQCCGMTALYTGVTIGGAPVLPIEPGASSEERRVRQKWAVRVNPVGRRVIKNKNKNYTNE